MNDFKVKGAWDFGYVWVDKERKYLYINLYSISSPDNITPYYINGKYCLAGEGKCEMQ